ncbi:hypothetical protein BHM03_00048323 [Ensete ventricosum]|nr:hypothetical protein BHM03_00048323 [Ensete ventricosum]
MNYLTYIYIHGVRTRDAMRVVRTWAGHVLYGRDCMGAWDAPSGWAPNVVVSSSGKPPTRFARRRERERSGRAGGNAVACGKRDEGPPNTSGPRVPARILKPGSQSSSGRAPE